MRVLIVDDEPPARARLRRLLAAFEDVKVVGEAADGEQALALLSQAPVDALFVDVQMPEVDGLDLAASLPEDGPALVFVTAHDRYALAAFDTSAVDYLLKPVEPERLARALQRLRARAPQARPQVAPPRRLLIPDRGRTHVVTCEQIEWLESADNYVVVHSAGRALLMRRTLAGLLADLGPGFVRVHRSAAVALAQVSTLRPRDKGDAVVVLRNGAEVACSRQYRPALVERLQR
ncbi:LytTR family DNA-binding domain-containing protein [Aquabacterium sp. A7-Y]|uniref:LytR/AlgR family response regulator transcription factor n=1 Tax=Aquabacterium sp. A7-Y TaxID=1349605 RepID=UPI00223CAB05|nr:LytTR family DNA-binding domain-containing protein [Aquabacterium sp. A7-Y]MCW7538638.1 LytTR family DNA-binding domain-containing protein [Aquabacterium sp. A7-Y]